MQQQELKKTYSKRKTPGKVRAPFFEWVIKKSK